MTTATITQRTELAHRTSDGIHVCLFWNQLSSRVTVRVFDERTNDGFELEVEGPEKHQESDRDSRDETSSRVKTV